MLSRSPVPLAIEPHALNVLPPSVERTTVSVRVEPENAAYEARRVPSEREVTRGYAPPLGETTTFVALTCGTRPARRSRARGAGAVSRPVLTS